MIPRFFAQYFAQCRPLVGLLALLSMVALPLHAQSLTIKADAPERYLVQTGDTLWDLANRFLNEPWLWPQLWHENPQIIDPDKIYPGDELRLIFDDKGTARLQVEGEGGVVKLSPGMRVSGLRQAIPPIPQQKIDAFIESHQVFSPEELAASAYVVGAEDDRLVVGTGNLVYVRGLTSVQLGSRYLIYRSQQEYKTTSQQKNSTQWLGVEMQYIGAAQLESFQAAEGIAAMRVLQAREEIRNNDILTLNDKGNTPATFYPQAPSRQIKAEIVSIMGGMSYGGKNSVIALSAGKLQRLVPGNILKIEQQRIPVKDEHTQENLVLPTEVTGTVMVFRTFKQISYALVLEASKPITVGDWLISPE
ncbi:LysM domain-containing protein [Oceanospirillum multiglobuliferum]|uniref:LysM domain-containing protein n=1 Tax=Oceanospirillum multiglobuliferum TaxID=64969 RepID=A0A1T4NS46_9GAMM|nr:LysM domain-containing protein [Oceanospirillum multiglobuliferum]OPX55712.1 hypothetical protein BTE48_07405 [Oceanospirillum multiglobuliferum]SJZ81518.1 LysM domain-containing protein [Oceanospirillum multiglobuliferum]